MTVWTVEAFTPRTNRSMSWASFLTREAADEWAAKLRADKSTRRRVVVKRLESLRAQS